MYLFVHQPDDEFVPELMIYFLECLRKRGIEVPSLRLLPKDQLSLPI